MLCVILRDNVVESITVSGNDPSWQPPEGTITILVPDGSYICTGFTYDGVDFHPPVE